MAAPVGYNLNPQVNDAFSLASLYLRTAGLPDTKLNRQMLAGWFWAESAHSGTQGVVVYNNNPLNITVSGSNPNYHLFSNNSLHFGNYADPTAGAQAWANLLNSNHSYAGIITAFRISDYRAFPSIVGKSPWGTSSGGVANGYNYMSKLAGDATHALPTGGVIGKQMPKDNSVVFHFFSTSGAPVDITYPIGTKIDQQFIVDLTNRLNSAGVFGGIPAGDLNPVNDLVRGAAYDAFKASLQPLIGTTVQKDTVGKFGDKITAAAGSQPGTNIFPDISGISGFFSNLNKSNVLHVAAIPAGAVLLFFGARIMLGSAGVGTQPQGGGGTTIIKQRAYPVIVRQ